MIHLIFSYLTNTSSQLTASYKKFNTQVRSYHLDENPVINAIPVECFKKCSNTELSKTYAISKGWSITICH